MRLNWIELNDCRSNKLAGTVLTKMVNKPEEKYFTLSTFIFFLYRKIARLTPDGVTENFY
jgi:hypothetical protein